MFERMLSLDDAGLDHEVDTIDKHVIVGKNKNTIIDFESSSTNRKPSNVTGATQGILIGTGLAKIIQKKVRLPPKENHNQSNSTIQENQTWKILRKLL